MNGEAEGRNSHERHEPYAWHEPMSPDKQEPKQSDAGNETVNHHLDDQGPEGLDSDELALRRMLHGAVGQMEPRDGTLDRLRHAVPARRARKRQAAMGMAAAALFIGTAVPALVHVSGAGGSDANPSIAGQASEAQGGAGESKGSDGGSGGNTGGSTDAGGQQGKGDTKGEGGGKDAGPGAGSPSADPSSTALSDAAKCTAAHLGSATASLSGPDSTGAVYGAFRVVNVSSESCTVGGAVTLSTTAQGAADATKISVTEHRSGDAAASLPDPSLYVTQHVLAPGSAYDVKFAWVPSTTCPTTGGDTGGASPSPTPTQQSGSTDATSSGVAGTSPQLVREDGGTADGSVVVTYTAEAGAATVSTTVSNACAGTVYRTGVLAQ